MDKLYQRLFRWCTCETDKHGGDFANIKEVEPEGKFVRYSINPEALVSMKTNVSLKIVLNEGVNVVNFIK